MLTYDVSTASPNWLYALVRHKMPKLAVCTCPSYAENSNFLSKLELQAVAAEERLFQNLSFDNLVSISVAFTTAIYLPNLDIFDINFISFVSIIINIRDGNMVCCYKHLYSQPPLTRGSILEGNTVQMQKQVALPL